MSELLQWVGWIGGASLIGWVILAVTAPHVLTVLSSWLTAMSPLVQGASEGVVWFFKTMWEGFKDVVDNSSTILFVFVVAALAMFYVKWVTPKQSAKTAPAVSCTQCIDSIRPDYKFVKRTEAEKREYLQRHPKPATSSWWEGFFKW